MQARAGKPAERPGRAREFRLASLAAFIGFIAILFATGVLAFIQLRTVYAAMEQVVTVHNRKTEITTEMQVAGLIRTESLYRMLILEDPFERDAMFLRYNGAAFRIGSARQRLNEFRMDADEERLFDVQGALIARVVEAQERVIDLAARDRIGAARDVMLTEAKPLQAAVHGTFEAMRRQQAEKTGQAMDLARKAYRETLWLFALVGVAALLGGAGIAALAYRHTHRIALHDALTGLLARAGFHDAVAREIAQRERDGGTFGLLYLDLDRFKPINDEFGHAAGDAILRETARRLCQCMRKGDIVARLGGDEFAVVVRNIRAPQDAEVAVRKISAAFEAPFLVEGRAHGPSVSIGAASYPEHARSVEGLIAAADQAMYAAKRDAGKSAGTGEPAAGAG